MEKAIAHVDNTFEERNLIIEKEGGFYIPEIIPIVIIFRVHYYDLWLYLNFIGYTLLWKDLNLEFRIATFHSYFWINN